MNTTGKVILGVAGLAIAIGIGVAIHRSMKTADPNAPATDADFDKFVSACTKAGYDIFVGLDAVKLGQVKKAFTKTVTSAQAKAAIDAASASKPEKDLSEEQKRALTIVIQKITQKGA